MENQSKTKLSPWLAARLQDIAELADNSRRSSRFWMDPYLTEIYGLYCQWSAAGVATQKAQQVGRHFRIAGFERLHPIRILIASTCPALDQKNASRSTRALEYAFYKETKPSDLIAFIRSNGGLAGCAEAMAQLLPKRQPRQHSSTTSVSTTNEDASEDEIYEEAVLAPESLDWNSTLPRTPATVKMGRRLRRRVELPPEEWGPRRNTSFCKNGRRARSW